MKIFYLTVLYFSFQAEIPFKNSDEFVVKVDLKFKQKPAGFDQNTYSTSGERLDKPKGDLAAFLEVDIGQVKILSDEIRIHAVDSKRTTILRKKASPVPELHFNLGFVDDVKAGKANNEITIYFLSAEKKELRKIVCTVQPDGTFLVNGQWHGKF